VKIRPISLHLLIALLATSCNHVYKEYDKDSFPTYTWKSGQEVTFTPKIEDPSKRYELILGVRHLYGLQLKSIPVTVTSISPSGVQTAKNYTLQIKNAQNENAGSCAGDICDLEMTVDDALKFEEAGEYKYIVKHNIPSSKILGIMELGLIIDEKE
jgi:gliding motility-associated lipoprotein GldH